MYPVIIFVVCMFDIKRDTVVLQEKALKLKDKEVKSVFAFAYKTAVLTICG